MEETAKKRVTAIILAAGSGKRMHSQVPKQYLMLSGKPVIFYAMQAFEASPLVDEMIVVAGKGDISYMKTEIVERYGFQKVSAVTEGGAERYFSVWNALQVMAERSGRMTGEAGYVLIHDGARPLVTEEIIEDTYRAAVEYGACCAAVPVKDTIKIADENGFAARTPERKTLFAVQTPQAFEEELILSAYGRLMERIKDGRDGGLSVTDDAMVVETMLKRPVKLVEASYDNIKITTPEDMEVAEGLLKRRKNPVDSLL